MSINSSLFSYNRFLYREATEEELFAFFERFDDWLESDDPNRREIAVRMNGFLTESQKLKTTLRGHMHLANRNSPFAATFNSPADIRFTEIAKQVAQDLATIFQQGFRPVESLLLHERWRFDNANMLIQVC